MTTNRQYQNKTTYQHGGTQIKSIEELCDEDVRFDDLLLVDLFDVVQDVEQPFELLLTRRHPDEVHLTTLHTKRVLDASQKDEVLEYRRVRGHSDATANEHGHLVVDPVLLACSEWTIHVDLVKVIQTNMTIVFLSLTLKSQRITSQFVCI